MIASQVSSAANMAKGYPGKSRAVWLQFPIFPGTCQPAENQQPTVSASIDPSHLRPIRFMAGTIAAREPPGLLRHIFLIIHNRKFSRPRVGRERSYDTSPSKVSQYWSPTGCVRFSVNPLIGNINDGITKRGSSPSGFRLNCQ